MLVVDPSDMLYLVGVKSTQRERNEAKNPHDGRN